MSILSSNPQILYREIHHIELQHQVPSSTSSITFGLDRSRGECKQRAKRDLRTYAAFWNKPPVVEMVELVQVENNEHFDQILALAQEASQPLIVDWMASWCRKCIYLKPKLEKLAAEYDTKFKFYCVDVNKVPQALVKRGNISKMPTIQLWKDGEMKAEVIGGHKAWLVIEEVREMIKPFLC